MTEPYEHKGIDNKRRYLGYFEDLAAGRASYRRNRRYYWDEITRFCDFFSSDNLSVLEIGCGTGELLNGVRASRKVGIDFSTNMIEQARSQFPAIDFKVMNAENLALNETFDLIIISNLIGFVDDVQQVFHELHKVCHPRTRIFVSYYNYFWEPLIQFAEFLGIKKRTPQQNWLSASDIKNLFYLAGFDTYRSTTRMLMPVNIPLIAFFLNRFLVKFPFFNYFGVNNYIFARPMPVSDIGMKHKYSVSVVIPARNESGNIEDAIKRMPVFGRSLEIIFVEGNSTDDTYDAILRVAEKYKSLHTIVTARQDGKGKGDAVRKGFGLATGDILMILDADLTVPPEELPKFYEAIASGKGEFINGSRLVYEHEKNAMRPLNVLGNKFFSVVFSWLLEQPFKDTLCGTKVLFRDDYQKLIANRTYFGEFDPFGDFDLLFGAFKLNLKITELPIRYRERKYGTTNISRFKHGFILLKMCLFAAKKIKFQ